MLGLKKQVARLEQTIMEKDLKGLVPLSEKSIEKGPMEVEALIKKMAMLEQTMILMKQKMATRRFFPTAFPVPASFASCT